MVTRVQVRPTLLAWAADRSGLDSAKINARFAGFAKWLGGEADPTFKQLEAFAAYTHTPLGYFFLPEPPAEAVPIPDFRTLGNTAVSRPSPDLLDTIYDCQTRQEWYREYAQTEGLEPLAFVGSVEPGAAAVDVATVIRSALGFGTAQRAKCRTHDDVRNHLINAIEGLGVLVMVSGVVGNNTHRRLNTREFRGFAIADPLAPLIFVNGADTKAAQLFTLIHELAHIWAGDTALSDADMSARSGQDKELWANKVAAEVLVPQAELKAVWPASSNTDDLERTAALFKISTLVTLKSAFDAGLIGWDDYRSRYQAEWDRVQRLTNERGSN
ncbi:MAG: ImmA/IrrE family metallo-endopeptidase [Propionibacteriaceae bacterium]|jgi:Zn-dependent peptidase ImmA (M78 family)|nr:ImmA/IrrE family metallo-endopeptidase [Propionibacteriaceae bacterium]